MPYSLNNVVLHIQQVGRFDLAKLAPGDAITFTLPAQNSPGEKEHVIARTEYVTHSGLKHFVLLTPAVTATTEEEKAK